MKRRVRSPGQYCPNSRRHTVEAACKCGAIAQVQAAKSVELRSAESDAAMIDYNRDRLLRHSFNRTAWIIIGVVVAFLVVGMYLYNSLDDDKSSATPS